MGPDSLERPCMAMQEAEVVPSRSLPSGDQGIHQHLGWAEVIACCGPVRLFTTNPVLRPQSAAVFVTGEVDEG